MQTGLTVRDVAADTRHPRNADCSSIQSTKAWGFACLFLRLSQIPGTNFPNIKEFSPERAAKKKWVEYLNTVYSTQPDDSRLFAIEGDIMELHPSIAVAIPTATLDVTEGTQLMPPFGSVQKSCIDDKVFLELRCLPDPSDRNTTEIPSLQTRLYWLKLCLDEALLECEKEGLTAMAIPYKFNCAIEGDEANWVRYKQFLSNWAKECPTEFKLIVVGSPD